MPPRKLPNGACNIGETSWGWIENCLPTKLDRSWRSLPGGELSGLLSRVVSAACSYELKNIPQRFVDPE
jgi:hypothetical protein